MDNENKKVYREHDPVTGYTSEGFELKDIYKGVKNQVANGGPKTQILGSKGQVLKDFSKEDKSAFPSFPREKFSRMSDEELQDRAAVARFKAEHSINRDAAKWSNAFEETLTELIRRKRLKEKSKAKEMFGL